MREKFTNLEPPTPNPRISLRIRDFLQIRHDWPLVTRVNHVARAGRKRVAPCQTRGGAGLECDDRASLLGRVGSAVADDVVGGDVVDRSIVGGHAHAVADRAVVDGDEDGVCGGGGGEGEGGEELHGCGGGMGWWIAEVWRWFINKAQVLHCDPASRP